MSAQFDPERCYLCGHASPRLMTANRSYSYLKCPACGFRRRHPIPTAEEEEHLYEEQYYTDRGLVIGLDEQPLLMRDLIDQRVATLTDLNGGPGRLLDVGSGTGLFIEASLRAGWQAAGLETSAAAARIAGTITTASVSRGRLEDQPLERRFDAISMWDVLEHLPDPRATLIVACLQLKPKGLIGISLPNVAGLKSRIRGNRWRYYQHSFGHISHFSPRTLSILLGQTGFKPERVWTTGAFNVGKPFGLDPAAVEDGHRVLRWVQARADSLVGGLSLGESLVAFARVRDS